MAAIGVFFLVLQTYVAFFKPRYFLVLYLLFSTSFLGFIPKLLMIGGNDVALFYQNFLMIACVIFHFKRISTLPKLIKTILYVIILIYLFGLFNSIILKLASPFQSLKGSKEFTSLFLTHYLFLHKNLFSVKFIEKIISFFGYYFLMILAVYILFDYLPNFYIKEDGIEYYYPTILSLFLFIRAARVRIFFNKLVYVVMLLIWSIGMYYEGHIAILLTTLVGCLSVLFRSFFINFVNKKQWFFAGLLFLALLTYILPFEKYFIEYNSLSSMKSRAITNVGRIDLIAQKPLLGYGFVDKTALQIESVNKYANNLYTIDNGYLDLLGKLGIIGTLTYLIALSFYFLKKENNIYTLSLKIFYLQLFFVNITWSVFSFTIGTLAISLSLYLMFKVKQN
jgi:hypothetical protein